MEEAVNGASQIWSTVKFQAGFKKAGGGRPPKMWPTSTITILSQEKIVVWTETVAANLKSWSLLQQVGTSRSVGVSSDQIA